MHLQIVDIQHRPAPGGTWQLQSVSVVQQLVHRATRAARRRVERVDRSHCSSMHLPIVLGELVLELTWRPASLVVHTSQYW